MVVSQRIKLTTKARLHFYFYQATSEEGPKSNKSGEEVISYSENEPYRFSRPVGGCFVTLHGVPTII